MSEIYIWQSRLGLGYPMADPTGRITGDHRNLDPIFKRRLAALAKDEGIVIVVTSQGGYRSYQDQVDMYDLYLAGELQSSSSGCPCWFSASNAHSAFTVSNSLFLATSYATWASSRHNMFVGISITPVEGEGGVRSPWGVS